jgi:tripeptidyl-peptidase-1
VTPLHDAHVNNPRIPRCHTVAAPSYHTASIATYLAALGTTNAGLFNRSSKGIPDIAAQGVDEQIIQNGKLLGVSGTPCSTPIFASVIALIK